MESIWLWAAGLVTSVGVFVHVVLGGKMFVRPFLTNDEISYLLAYRDPNSSFRSFRRWTGQTPNEFRAASREGALGAS